VIYASAGTLFSNGADKHHEVTVDINHQYSMTIDIYDEQQVSLGSKQFAQQVNEFINSENQQAEESGGDAKSILAQLKAQGFERSIKYQPDDLKQGWVRTHIVDQYFRSEIKAIKENPDMLILYVYHRTGNKEVTKSIKRITMPMSIEDGIEIVWSELEKTCEILKGVFRSTNANIALDQLCQRP
jgi:hypothetical protein